MDIPEFDPSTIDLTSFESIKFQKNLTLTRDIFVYFHPEMSLEYKKRFGYPIASDSHQSHLVDAFLDVEDDYKKLHVQYDAFGTLADPFLFKQFIELARKYGVSIIHTQKTYGTSPQRYSIKNLLTASDASCSAGP